MAAMTDHRQTIIESLTLLKKKSIADNEPFKARAYQKVIGQLKDMPVFTKDDIPALEGAGDKIIQKIQEIVATGKLESAERARQDNRLEIMEAFQNIYGVGPVKARELVEKGYRSIEALRTDPQFLNDKQKIGLKYYEPLLERIPREEMMNHEHMLLINLPDMMDGDIVGSFRRGAASSGDIDLLIKEVDIHAYVNDLVEQGYIMEILAMGENKCMAIAGFQTPRRLDILLTPLDEYAYAMLYFTGSQQFNIAFRQHAVKRGYTLNEHGMKQTTAKTKAPFMAREQDIFEFLGLQYIEPEERMDGKQIILKC
jgi:DNA polymerase/3'-5' exonuclease PolX